MRILTAVLLLTCTLYSFSSHAINNEPTYSVAEMMKKQDSVLRHVVLFKFKEGTSEENLTKILTAFSQLPSKIPQIKSYEWGLNNSPEGLEKGFTHCFFLTFNSEEDRAIYLPHPDHKAFGALLGPHLDDVLVVDYWTK
ncbi:Dabb family protein [Arenibacter sp. GZD96]|uniref:Dabb family protein n=1 Tax=Aurantibrevibacter litoralis TaxID=3106030 RepID=UPI002AFEECB8|nr:Dabb family protein [Arenibacter sp. GZD-96]MEA1787084.1 Dabb family protein [Arenibacter sp. GZD-96]